jgi:PAS domain-containing protein
MKSTLADSFDPPGSPQRRPREVSTAAQPAVSGGARLARPLLLITLALALWALYTFFPVIPAGAFLTGTVVLVAVAGALLGVAGGIAASIIALAAHVGIHDEYTREGIAGLWRIEPGLHVCILLMGPLFGRTQSLTRRLREELRRRRTIEAEMHAHERYHRRVVTHLLGEHARMDGHAPAAPETDAVNTGEPTVIPDDLPVAVAMLDTDMNYIAATRRWRELIETGDDIAGRPYEATGIVPSRWVRLHERSVGGTSTRVDEDPIQRRDGTIEWVSWEAAPWTSADGTPGGVVVRTDAVGHRKRENERLVRREQQLRGVVAHLPEPVIEMDLSGNILFASREVAGLPPEDVVGTRVYDYLPEAIHDPLRCAITEAMQTGAPRALPATGAGRVVPVYDGEFLSRMLLLDGEILIQGGTVDFNSRDGLAV